MAVITNRTVTTTKRETLPDGSTRTVTETEIDTAKTAAIARVWLETSYQFQTWTVGYRKACWGLAAALVLLATVYAMAYNTPRGGLIESRMFANGTTVPVVRATPIQQGR
jgi:hypothetical protein